MAPCPACTRAEPEVFFSQAGVPTNSCQLLDSQEEAQGYATGSLRLGVCPTCGFIWNLDFDPGLTTYSSAYEETQGFSPHFRAFAKDLAQSWVERYDLREKHVLEIGCGKGEFLALLCELGGNRGTGIDPAYVPGRLESPALDRMDFVIDFYSEASGPVEADAVVCRHTLEHIPAVAEFVRAVRRNLGGRRIPVLFELPDTWRILRDDAFWDLYYEHCSYFTAGSLARLFRQEGFAVVDLRMEYDDQYLILETFPDEDPAAGSTGIEESPEEVVAEARAFAQRYASAVAERNRFVEDLVRDGRRAVVWGAGSKGVAWLTSLDSAKHVPFAVDINPFKQGKYIAGTGHRIVGPDDLREQPPDVVIVMNAVYRDEIAGQLQELGIQATLVDA